MRHSHLGIALIVFGVASGATGHVSAGGRGGGMHGFGGSPHPFPAFHPHASSGWGHQGWGPVRMGNAHNGGYSFGHPSAWHVATGGAYGGSYRGSVQPGSWHVNTGAGLAPSGAWHMKTGQGYGASDHRSGYGGSRWSSGYGHSDRSSSYYQRSAYAQGYGGGSSYVSGYDGGYSGSYDQGYGGGTSYQAPIYHEGSVGGGSYHPAGYDQGYDEGPTYEPSGNGPRSACACHRRGFGSARWDGPRFHYEWVRRRVYDEPRRAHSLEPTPVSYGQSWRGRDHGWDRDRWERPRYRPLETRY